jgi:hypothetical protein
MSILFKRRDGFLFRRPSAGQQSWENQLLCHCLLILQGTEEVPDFFQDFCFV